MLTSEAVKDFAKECGADLVGIGSMDRFAGAPKWADPRYVFPDAKVVIALAFRIPRGYLRGIEEGTHFYQYPAMGYSSINEVYAPMVLRELACFLEDEGYEGGAWRNTGGRGAAPFCRTRVSRKACARRVSAFQDRCLHMWPRRDRLQQDIPYARVWSAAAIRIHVHGRPAGAGPDL